MAMESESEEKAAALAHLKSAMSDLRALRQSVSPVEVENAITAIVAFLRTDWHTGGGRRLQQFVWSLWNMEHLELVRPGLIFRRTIDRSRHRPVPRSHGRRFNRSPKAQAPH